MKSSAPKTVLCIHDLSGVGRCSLSVASSVLAAMGHQAIALPTALFSTHTGGLGTPASLSCGGYGAAALQHYHSLDLSFDCIYSGYLATHEDQQLVNTAFDLWPEARKVVDPVMGDHGTMYTGMQDKLEGMKALCRRADIILPNLTEASLLLGCPYPENDFSKEEAIAFASGLSAYCAKNIVTGVPSANHVLCVSGGDDDFVVQRLRLERNYPGTGDLFASLLVGALLRGNALSAAVDAAAGFVYDAILNTDPKAPTELGVWFEPLLGRQSPQV